MTGAIEAGTVVRLTSDDGSAVMDVVLESVTQRNWSRVGRGRSRADGGPVFVKQFVDRAGEPHSEQQADERAGTGVLARLEAVDATVLIGADDDLLVLGFGWQEATALDELLRNVGDAAFLPRWEAAVAPRLEPLIDDLVALADDPCYQGRRKVRPYSPGSAAEAVLLKGLDIRNLALRADAATPLVFDPGRWYRGPVEEGAAKLLVSIGMMNWGNPPTRFRRGVPTAVLDSGLSRIGHRTHREAIAAELHLQRRMRLGGAAPIRGINGLIRTGAVRLWGPRYLDELEACFDRWWS